MTDAAVTNVKARPRWYDGVFWRASAYAAVFLGFTVALIWCATSDEKGRWYAAMMLVLSPILLLVGMRLKHPPRFWIGGTCLFLEIVKAVLLFVYERCGVYKSVATFFSFAALSITGIMLLVVLVLARITIDDRSAQDTIRRHSFAAICAAFYLFCHVGYELTFALALHDRRGPTTALYATQAQLDTTHYTFVFAEGGASIDMAVQLSRLIKDEDWPVSRDDQRTVVANQYLSNDSDDLDDVRHNVAQWKKLHTALQGAKPNWWRVTVVGHASDALADVEGPVKNQELSDLRMRQMFESLRSELPGVRVEWVLRATSNDDTIMAREFRDGRDHKLSVEVALQKHRSLELLDYAYFMTYTITTTGYGDLVPVSPRAKFISSVANIFELLFIVVLLNLVLVYGTRAEAGAVIERCSHGSGAKAGDPGAGVVPEPNPPAAPPPVA